MGSSLAIQGSRLRVSTVGGVSWIPGQRTKTRVSCGTAKKKEKKFYRNKFLLVIWLYRVTQKEMNRFTSLAILQVSSNKAGLSFFLQ